MTLTMPKNGTPMNASSSVTRIEAPLQKFFEGDIIHFKNDYESTTGSYSDTELYAIVLEAHPPSLQKQYLSYTYTIEVLQTNTGAGVGERLFDMFLSGWTKKE
jgi:hypothetical protein